MSLADIKKLGIKIQKKLVGIFFFYFILKFSFKNCPTAWLPVEFSGAQLSELVEGSLSRCNEEQFLSPESYDKI